MKKFLLGVLLLFPGTSYSQYCANCITNSAVPQNAQFNVSSATIRGNLTVGSISISTINLVSATAGVFTGSGTYLTNLNASQLLFGSVPAAAISGNFPALTGVGPLTSGIWHGSIIGSQYGGTGANLVTSGIGSIPYFSSVGTMSALAPTTAGYLLQTNGASLAPTWTGAPQVLGTNVTAIPMANLLPGQLPTTISINDASISTVSASKVIGNIPGNATNITGTLAIGQLGAGTLNTSNAASSVTASGVTPGIWGGPTQLTQLTVAYDGRITSIAQSTLTVYASSLAAGALPLGVTITPPQIVAGTLGASVIASSVVASGVRAGLYGFASQVSTFTVGIDGRLTRAGEVPIAINTTQINNGTLPLGVVVPAANIQAGALAANVLVSSVSNSGVAAGVYGVYGNIPQITIGPDGRVTSALQYGIPGLSTSAGFAYTNVDNAWTHSQTFLGSSSITVNSTVGAGFFNGDGASIFNLAPSNMAAGSLPFSVMATSVSLSYLQVPSSVTASAFFGDGSHLTGITITTTNFVSKTGDTMTGSLYISGSSLAVNGNISSTGTAGGTVFSGSGTRFMWIPSKHALRAGEAAGSEWDNNNIGDYSVGFGYNSLVNGFRATVGGGFFNTSSNNETVVGGGTSNTASGSESTVGGGYTNTASGQWATVPGGHVNTAAGTYSFAAGCNATANNSGSFVWSDGHCSAADTGVNQFVVSAASGAIFSSSVTGSAFFGDGSHLTGITTATGTFVLKSGDTMTGSLFLSSASLVVNGVIASTGTVGNTPFSGAGTRFMWIPSKHALRAGSVQSTEWDNTNIGNHSVALGSGTIASGLHSVVSGGSSSTASGIDSAVGGGENNTASGNDSHIGGGSGNAATGQSAVVAGGTGNTNDGIYGSILGGQLNTVSSGKFYGAVAGGAQNAAGGDYSSILGGQLNSASGSHASIGGGSGNIASGDYATIPGGAQNLASGNFSFAAGLDAHATSTGSFVWADSQGVTLTGYIRDQFLVRSQGGFEVVASSLALISTTGINVFSVDASSAQFQVPVNVLGSSVNASAFFGDGSHLSNVSAASTVSVTSSLYGDGSSGNPLGVNSSSVAVLSGGFVLNSQIDPSSVTKQGFVALSNLSGAVPSGRVDFSTITAAIAVKASSGTNADITRLTVLNTISSAVTTLSSTTNTSAEGILIASSVTANAFFGDGSHLTGVTASSYVATTNGSMYGNGTPGSPLGVLSSSVAVLSGGFVLNSQLDPSSVTKQGFVSLANLSGAVPSGRVDFSTITTSLATKASTGTNSDITQLTALNIISSAVTMTSSMTNTSANGILVISSVTAGAFFGDGSHLTGVTASSYVATVNVSMYGNGTTGAPLGVLSSSVAVLSGGFVLNSQIDPSSVTKQGFVALSNLSGAVPSGRVDFSTITTAISVKASSGTNADITRFTALNTISSAYTATSSMTNTSTNGILATSSVTANAFFGDGSHLTGITKSSITVVPNTAFTNTTYSAALSTVTLVTRGGIVMVTFSGAITISANGNTIGTTILVDGAFDTNGAGSASITETSPENASTNGDLGFTYYVTGLSAASHTFAICFKTTGNTGTVIKDATHYTQFSAREIQ